LGYEVVVVLWGLVGPWQAADLLPDSIWAQLAKLLSIQLKAPLVVVLNSD